TLSRVRHDSSTQNLKDHVSSCKAVNHKDEQVTMKEYTHGHQYSAGRMCYLLALWVARRHRPFKIVEDPELIEIFKMLYSKVMTPSRFMVARDVDEIFTTTKAHVKQYLIDMDGKVHVVVDGWTAPQVISFLGITVQFVKNGQIRSFILDFIRLLEGHTGEYLAEKLAECLNDYGLSNKVIALTSDNASNNRTLCQNLTKHIPSFKGESAWVRCFAHTINLAVKAILSHFLPQSKKDRQGLCDAELIMALEEADHEEESTLKEDQEEDEWEEDEDRCAFDEADVAALDSMEEISGLLVEGARADVNKVKMAIIKVSLCYKYHMSNESNAAFVQFNALCVRFFHSPTLRSKLEELYCIHFPGNKVKGVIRYSPTRWDGLTDAVERGLELQPLLDNACIATEFNPVGRPRLDRLKLTEDEWKLLRELLPLLQCFRFATKRMSLSSMPLIHQVIPCMDSLTLAVETYRTDPNTNIAIRVAATRGRAILDKYYTKTDDSSFYRCAMLLCPQYKETYFKKALWPESWKKEAVRQLKEEWKNY
ncbi:hypothetical protein M422DRAFT_147370, partial [Sphaerobolus stellatus SS14]